MRRERTPQLYTDPEFAERLAIEALSFLSEDPERLARFLVLSGLRPDTLRLAAASTGFLGSILDYVASDETLLLAFAHDRALAPDAIAASRRTLAGKRGPEAWE